MREDQETIGAAIGRIPSGCAILTAAHNGLATGMLVSWVQQASFDPPLVTVCLKEGRPAAGLIDRSGHFLLNLVGDDHTEMFKHYGKGYCLEDDAFEGMTVRETCFGPLLESCIAHLGCDVRDTLAVGDHKLYVGEVVAGGVVEDARPYTHLRKNGMSY